MDEEKKDTKKPSLFEIATKTRYLALVEKLQRGKPLSRSELSELKRFETSDLPDGVVETVVQVGKTFGVSERTVYNWLRNGMPVTESGHYDIDAIYAWKIEREADGKDVGLRQKWETHFRQYKALTAEIEYRRKLGELVTKDEMEQGRVQRILIIKRALLGLPARLAPQVVNLEIKKAEEIIRIRIEEIIGDFARGGDGTGNIEPDNADVVGS
jgi:phage terminase Nu1 subunit (DNA packaging protein)